MHARCHLSRFVIWARREERGPRRTVKSSANQECVAGGAAGAQLSLIGGQSAAGPREGITCRAPIPAGYCFRGRAGRTDGGLPPRKSGPVKSTSFYVFLASLFLTSENGGDSCCSGASPRREVVLRGVCGILQHQLCEVAQWNSAFMITQKKKKKTQKTQPGQLLSHFRSLKLEI